MKTVYRKVKTIRPSTTIKKDGSGSLSRSKIIIIPAGTFINSSLQSDLNNNINTTNNVTIREVNRNSICSNSDSGSESDYSNNSVELNNKKLSNKSNYNRVIPKTHYRSLLLKGNLTKEEKLQRRKLKNRLAAQHCRDKKRIKMEEMEMEINMLKEKNRNLESINDELRNENDVLTSKNEILRSFGLKTTSEIIQEKNAAMLFQPNIVKNKWPLSPQNTNGGFDDDDSLNGLNEVQENVDFLEQITDEDITFQSDVSNIFDAKWPWEKDLEELFIPDL